MRQPVVAIHQPQYLPTLRYFAKAAACDVFVYLDTVQFQRRGFQNRNMVKTPHGARMLTVPVNADRETAIRDVAIAGDRWIDKHVTTLAHAYGKAPHYGWLRDELVPLLSPGAAKLSDLNIATTGWVFQRLGLKCREVRASELDVAGTKEDLIVAICKAVGARTYYSGEGARAYQDPATFAAAGIELQYQQFVHPTYPQQHEEQGFLPDMAAIDLLANAGPRSHDILRTATP
ncbi:MAG: WbqC family protein [Cyanobacteria bacterium]|nr:WbqC family protein [Cyanobacteriota bacterium]